MSNTYIVNPQVVEERLTVKADQARDKIAAKWTPFDPKLTDGPDSEGFCGNYSSAVYYNGDAKQWQAAPDGRDYNLNAPGYVSKCGVISSALLLYRLACVFKPIVRFDGPDGYKSVWTACFRHNKSGQEIMLYEWKGGFTFGARASATKRKPGSFYTPPIGKQFAADFLQLLNLLCSDQCPHPYDGTVAGSVA